MSNLLEEERIWKGSTMCTNVNTSCSYRRFLNSCFNYKSFWDTHLVFLLISHMKYKTHCYKGQDNDTQSRKSTATSMETMQVEEGEADSLELYF